MHLQLLQTLQRTNGRGCTMKGTVVLLWLLPCVIYGARQPEPRSKNRLSLFSATNAEIQSVSQELYLADVNRAAIGDITLNLQYKVSSSQTGTGSDYASQKLFSYVNEAKLFARPTFSRLKSLLDNYVKTTGTVESVTSAEVQEQNAFIDEIFKTSVITKLSNFFLYKGFYKTQLRA
ncbi:hypothetical protein FKM82_026336 [Ascaphus truei]